MPPDAWELILGTQVNLDGTIDLTLPSGVVVSHPLSRLSRLSEGLLEHDLILDGDSSDRSHDEEDWLDAEDGVWAEHIPDEDERDLWEESDHDGDEVTNMYSHHCQLFVNGRA